MPLIRIGHFSQLAQVSTRTLRLYDERNLLKPVYVEGITGYRFYSLEQLPRLNRILAFKELGFSLEQVAEILTSDLSIAQLSDLLAKKHQEVEQELQARQIQMSRISSRLRQIEAEGKISPYEIIVKEIPALTIASIRRILPTLHGSEKERVEMYRTLHQRLTEKHIQPAEPELVIYHNTEYVDENLDIETATALVMKKPRLSPDVEPALHELAFTPLMATTVHHGPFADVPQAITAVCMWAVQNRFNLNGAFREIHLFGREMNLTSLDNVTVEIQIPIEKNDNP